MSRASGAGQGAKKDSFNASSQHDQSDLRTIHEEIVSPINITIPDALRSEITDLQQHLTDMDCHIQKLNVRISELERKLENENNPVFPSQSHQTDALLRPEAIALDKKGGSYGLSQPLSHLQRDLEDLCHQNYPSDLSCFKNIHDSLRSLVKTELDAIIEERVRSVIESNNYQLLPIASEKTRNTNQCQEFKFNAQRRQKSQEDSQEFRFPQKPHDEVKRQPDTRETKVCAVGPFKETTDDSQLKHDEASKNVARTTESPFSAKQFKKQISIDTKIADESVNTFQESQQATSNRALKQQTSIESRLEQDESDKNREMHSANRTSIRTLNQQMSLEGMLESDESVNSKEMHLSISYRTLNQQISLEGQLEEETDESVITEKRSATVARNLQTQLSIEGKLLEATSTTAEMQPTISTLNANTKILSEACTQYANKSSTLSETQKSMFGEACSRKGSKSNTLGAKARKSDSRPKSAGLFRKKHP